jgi:photosystem II stability/assembly factor-like uncharacterized protein
VPSVVARRFVVAVASLVAAYPSSAGSQQARRAQATGATGATAAAPVPPGWPDSTSWRHLGPAAFGGRIDDIEAVADDPRIIFVGAASGGVFRSVNNGVTWEPVLDRYAGSLSVGDIAIAPSDRNVVWVGMGEPNSRQSSTWGDGVYRSLDGGTTWQHMGLRETQTIGRIVIDPRDANTVFVAALGHLWGPNEQRGLYRTKDGGRTWQKVLGVDEHTGAVDVAIDRDGRTLFAATYQRRRRAFGFAGSGPGSALWRSLDGGDTWERLGATHGLPTGDIGRIGVAIAASEPDVVYAVIEARGGGVFRSVDRGRTWTRQSATNQRASYYSQIRVDPNDANRVWLLATSIFSSGDGGKTFRVDSTSQTRVHPDHHALWIDPRDSRHMLLGNDGGLYVSYDRAEHWQFIDNLPISQFYDIAVDRRDPYWIFGGAQDNGQWALPSRTFSRGGMTNADVINTGYADGFQAAVDQRDPRFVYTESQNGRLYLIDMQTREERWISPSSADPKERYRFNWNTPLVAVPDDTSLVYYGAHRLLETRDRGNTWTAASGDLTTNPADWRRMPLGPGFPNRESLSRDDGISNYGTITTIGVTPKAPGLVYVGTDDGQVQVTTDGGAKWTNITSRFRLPGPRWVGKVLPSRVDARVAYVVFDGHNDDDLTPHVFRSTDGGVTWTSIAGDLPNGVVARTIEEHPRNPNLLFLGTEFGLYWTFDGGRHWTRATGNMPPVRVDRVILNDETNDLIVATHGRGIIVLDDVAPLELGGAGAIARGDVKLLPPRAAAPAYEWRDLPWASANAFVAPNPPVGTYVTYAIGESAGAVAPVAPAASGADTSRARAPAPAKIQILGPDGRVVRELTGPGGPGTHRVLWDLRAAMPFLPAPSDSGYYGAYRGPFVLPGRYSAKLIVGGKEQTQPVEVRADPRAHTTPAALASRHAMSMRIATLSGIYADAAKAFATVEAEVTRLAAAVKAAPNAAAGADSVVTDAAKKVAELKPRLAPSYGTPIGRAFDLLGAIQSSSGAPTEAEQRILDSATSDLREAITKLNDLITATMPAVRTRVGAIAMQAVPVRVP